MEVFATVQVLSSVVQLVDFSSKCIGKGIQLYRSNSGILDENAAIQLAVDHLVSLKDEVVNASPGGTEVSLQNLCEGVTEAASELLDVLKRLKVSGDKSKWKSMRKAIRSVWSKEKVQELEKRLASFRDELNLHFAVRLREQIHVLEADTTRRFDACDEKSKEILEAVIAERDLFAMKIDDQTILIQTAQKDIKVRIDESHIAISDHISKSVAESSHASQSEHGRTRQEIVNNIGQQSHQLHDAAVQEIQNSDMAVQQSIVHSREANEVEHENTRAQIAELQEAMQLLSVQIAERDEEHKQLLIAFNKTKSSKKRRVLAERSNAVTAALLALKTVYNFLKVYTPPVHRI